MSIIARMRARKGVGAGAGDGEGGARRTGKDVDAAYGMHKTTFINRSNIRN
jgi:hypothetical protein